MTDLTTGTDLYVGTTGDDLVNALTASTLNAGDSLDGGAGTDILTLYGGGTFDLSALAQFVNFETINLFNTSTTAAALTLGDADGLTVNWSSSTLGDTLTLGGGTITVVADSLGGSRFSGGDKLIFGSGAANVTVGTIGSFEAGNEYVKFGTGQATLNVSSSQNASYTFSSGDVSLSISGFSYFDNFHLSSGSTVLNLGDSYYSNVVLADGAVEVHSQGSLQITLNDASYWKSGDIFDATGGNIGVAAGLSIDAGTAQLAGANWSFILGTGATLTVTAADLAHISYIGGAGTASTTETALDLTHLTLNSTLVSTNASGTSFTVDTLAEAQQVYGGAGDDTLVAQGFTFTEAQRNAIFALSSIETIQDSSGTSNSAGRLSVSGNPIEGGALVASVAWYGLVTTEYQWQRLSGGSWVDIAGADQASFSFGNDQTFVGSDIRIVATGTDNQGNVFTLASIGYVVEDVNDAPTGAATAVLPAGSEDTSYTVSAASLLEGFSDIDGDPLSVVNLAVDHGAVTDNGNGSFTITPTSNYNGKVELTYSVTDGALSVAGSQSFTLAAVNDAPTGVTLQNALLSIPEGGLIKVGDILVSDDGMGTNTLSLSGADAAYFSISGSAC